jgi:hypothetical protein
VAQTERKTKRKTQSSKSSPEKKKAQQKEPVQPPIAIDPAALIAGPDQLAYTEQVRLDRIRESHVLLQQFTPKELKILMNLKRNTSPKAWTLREDLVVLSLPLSNREIAEILNDRNKEAVKKRLQLLRSKGLNKREPGIFSSR